jgi:PAS domain S-box-containing protein
MTESALSGGIGDDTRNTLRASLQALLESARLVTGARAVALAAPAGAPGAVTVAHGVGPDLVAGATLNPDATPGLRALALPALSPDLPAPSATLLVLRGLVSAEPGSALSTCLVALSAVVQSAQAAEGARRARRAEPAAAPAPPLPVGGYALLQNAATRVRGLLEADLASIALAEPDGRLIWRAMVGYHTQSLRAGLTPPEARLARQVATSGRLKIIAAPDTAEEAFHEEYPMMRAESLAVAIGVPLLIEQRPVGALIVGWREDHEIPPAEQRLLETLADQVAGVVIQMRLSEEAGRQRTFLERLIHHAPAGILALSAPDWRVREVNRFALQFLDEPFRSGAESLYGRSLDEFLPQARESGILAMLEQVAATGEALTITDFAYRGFARGVTYWDWSVVPLPDPGDGAAPSALLLMVETTEKAQARARLAEALASARRQAAELDTVIQQMVEGVAIADRDGTITKINPAGEALLGRGVAARGAANYSEQFQIYDLDGRLYAPTDLPIARAGRGETVLNQDLVVRLPNGQERILSVSGAPLLDDAGAITGAVAVFHDVTKAREVERLKDEFLSVVSHELRTPLAAILGYSDILLRELGGPLTEKQRQTQRSIKGNAMRLLGLVNDMLDVSKLEAQSLALDLAPVRVQDAIPQAAGRVQALAAAREVSVQQQVDARLPAVLADEARLQQILANLLSNAIKFSPVGGTVIVRAALSGLPADAPPQQPESALAPSAGRSLLVMVQDTGVGLQAEQLTTVWDRFYQVDSTTRRRHGGAGLGLAIVRRLVALHGGQVWATSAGVDKGSAFYFRLPLAPAAGAVPALIDGARETPAAGRPGAPLILVVEADSAVASIMSAMLRGVGYGVAVAPDGPQGLAAAARLQPAAILLDVASPPGWRAAPRLLQDPATPAIPTLLVAIEPQQRLGVLLGRVTPLGEPPDVARFLAALPRPPPGAARRALVVDPDPTRREMLVAGLRKAGYDARPVVDGGALRAIAAAPPDLLVIDPLTPDGAGFAVLEAVRAAAGPAAPAPCILTPARDLTHDESARLDRATQDLIARAGMSIGELLRVVKETLETLYVRTHDDSADPAR